MMKNTPVTVLLQSQQERITLTSYAIFALTPDRKKAAFVRQSGNQIDFQPYWNPMRHAIARVHNAKIPNINELRELISSQTGSKKLNYILAVKGYVKALSTGCIEGKKVKRCKSNVYYESLTLGLNPELHLSNRDEDLVIKLHINKSLRMTTNVANQMIAIMEQEFKTAKRTKYLVIDVNDGAVFEKTFTGEDLLEQVALNCQKYSDLNDLDKNQDLAA